jgi:hypothetical protein
MNIMKKYIFLQLIFVVGIGSSLAKAEPNSDYPIKVSIINLIADPIKYKNKAVEVCGYYRHEDGIEGGNYLFFTKEYAEIDDKSNAISLPKNIKNTDGTQPSPGRYIRITGVIDDYDDKQNFLKEIYMKEVYAVVGYILEKETRVYPRKADIPPEESQTTRGH